jgi:hypothetical protein
MREFRSAQVQLTVAMPLIMMETSSIFLPISISFLLLDYFCNSLMNFTHSSLDSKLAWMVINVSFSPSVIGTKDSFLILV